MSTQAGIFVLDMLADYKMPQTTLQGVMKKTDQLVKSQVDEILSEISRRIAAGGDLQNEIASFKAMYKNSSVFEGLEYQEKQQQTVLH